MEKKLFLIERNMPNRDRIVKLVLLSKEEYETIVSFIDIIGLKNTSISIDEAKGIEIHHATPLSN